MCHVVTFHSSKFDRSKTYYQFLLSRAVMKKELEYPPITKMQAGGLEDYKVTLEANDSEFNSQPRQQQLLVKGHID